MAILNEWRPMTIQCRPFLRRATTDEMEQVAEENDEEILVCNSNATVYNMMDYCNELSESCIAFEEHELHTNI
jgi:hypothetical protein